MCNRGPRLQPNFAQEVSARRTGPEGRAAAARQKSPVAARHLRVAGSGQRRGEPGAASAGPVQLDRPVAAGENNERTSMRIRTPGGAEVIVVVQIAGLLARRMVCDVPVDDKLDRRHLRADLVRIPAGQLPARGNGPVGPHRATRGCG